MSARHYSCDTKHLLGKGSSSNVYMGRMVKTGEKVAIKRINYSRFNRVQLLQLQKEVRILKRLADKFQNKEKNPFVHLYDVQDDGNILNIVTEFLEGDDIDDYCSRFASMAIPERIGKWIFLKLLESVKVLHENDICHLDLKLENIKYNRNDNSIKILDFGFAQETTRKTRMGMIPKKQNIFCGSVHYVSPEIVLNIPFDGKKSDIWSLGVCLYTILTGHFPFDSDIENYSEYKENIFDKIVANQLRFPSYISTDAQIIIKSMMNNEPDKRPDINTLLQQTWFCTD